MSDQQQMEALQALLRQFVLEKRMKESAGTLTDEQIAEMEKRPYYDWFSNCYDDLIDAKQRCKILDSANKLIKAHEEADWDFNCHEWTRKKEIANKFLGEAVMNYTVMLKLMREDPDGVLLEHLGMCKARQAARMNKIPNLVHDVKRIIKYKFEATCGDKINPYYKGEVTESDAEVAMQILLDQAFTAHSWGVISDGISDKEQMEALRNATEIEEAINSAQPSTS